MSSSRPEIPSSQMLTDRLSTLLNLVIKPVTNQKVKADDVNQFISLLHEGIFGQQALELLSETNTDFLIRLFFPTVQLPRSLVNFIKETVIVFRSEAGLYKYQHRNSDTGWRVRHEVRMGFLELFLFVNYGVNFRIMSTENATHIGIWNRDFKQRLDAISNVTANYEIEIIPPKSEDFFKILKSVAVLQTFFKRITLPIVDFSSNPLQNIGPLKTAIKLAFEKLQIHDLMHEIFQQLPQTFAPADSKTEKMLEDDAALAQANAIIERLHPPFDSFFTLLGKSITLHSFENHPQFRNDLLNYFKLQFLLLASKEQYNQVANWSRDEMYKGDGPITDRNKSIKAWIYQILSVICAHDVDDMLDIAVANLYGNADNNFQLTNHSINIPIKIFNMMFTEKNIALLARYNDMKVLKLFIMRDGYRNQTTEALLTQLFNMKKMEHASFYIRKIINRTPNRSPLLTVEHLQKEFGFDEKVDAQMRVKPATFMVPGIPIATYKGLWTNASGVIIITPPDEAVPMAGFKRTALADGLKGDRAHTFGFPFRVGPSMRSQGGKPSYTVTTFFKRILAIDLRAKGKLVDMSRKEFFRNYFIGFNNQSLFNDFLNCEISFSNDELKAFLNNKNISASSTDYNIYLQISDLLKRSLLSYPAPVIEHYFQSFNSIVRAAIENKKSITSVLYQFEQDSFHQRLKRIVNNKYAPQSAQLPQPMLHSLAKAGRRYYHLEKSLQYQHSNEVLLQGLRPYDNAVDDQFPIVNDDMKPAIIIKRNLLTRHGNFPAVYANTFSIADAILIHLYLKEQYGKPLPFVTYDENLFEFTVHSPEHFMQTHQETWNAKLRIFNQQNSQPVSIPASTTLLPSILANSSPTPPPSLSPPPYVITGKKRKKPSKIVTKSKVPHENFKYSVEWKENRLAMLKEISKFEVCFKKVCEQVDPGQLQKFGKNFTCKSNLTISVRRKNTAFAPSATIPFEFKCINGNFAIKCEGGMKRPEEIFHHLILNKINTKNYNPANEPLTNSSFELMLEVHDVTLVERDVNENLFYFVRSELNYCNVKQDGWMTYSLDYVLGNYAELIRRNNKTLSNILLAISRTSSLITNAISALALLKDAPAATNPNTSSSSFSSAPSSTINNPVSALSLFSGAPAATNQNNSSASSSSAPSSASGSQRPRL
jgi:hypothetical protein